MGKVIVGLIAAALVAAICFVVFAQRSPGSAADRQLLEAAHKNEIEGVRAALAAGANASYSVQASQWERWFGEENAEEGYTALHYFAQMGNVEGAKLLVDKGANINAQSIYKNTPLMIAAGALRVDFVRFLLDLKADPNIKNKWGSTAKNFSVKRNGSATGDEIGAMITAAGGVAGEDGTGKDKGK